MGCTFVIYVVTKIPGLGGGAAQGEVSREAIGGHCHSANERGRWPGQGLAMEGRRRGDFQRK